jgi:hypothetical protein
MSNLDPKLRVSVFSQNSIKHNINPKINIAEIFGVNGNELPDIYAEMTQEDCRSNFDSLAKLPGNYTNIKVRLNSLTNICKNVVLQIFHLDKYNGKITSLTGTIPLERSEQKSLLSKVYATKGAVYIYIEINNTPMLFVNMHLPINTKDKDHPGEYGFEHRKNSLLKVIKELNAKFKNENPIIIMGGDLNFRIVPSKRLDQLTNLIKEDQINPFIEIPFMNEEDKIFTCKFKKIHNLEKIENFEKDEKDENQEKYEEIGEKNSEEPVEEPVEESVDETKKIEESEGDKYKNCRNKQVPKEIDKGTATNHDIDVIHIQDISINNCRDTKRFPSRCDRFLINTMDGIEVKHHKGKYFSEIDSDHNAIYTVLDIDIKTRELYQNNNDTIDHADIDIPKSNKFIKTGKEFIKTGKQAIRGIFTNNKYKYKQDEDDSKLGGKRRNKQTRKAKRRFSIKRTRRHNKTHVNSRMYNKNRHSIRRKPHIIYNT